MSLARLGKSRKATTGNPGMKAIDNWAGRPLQAFLEIRLLTAEPGASKQIGNGAQARPIEASRQRRNVLECRLLIFS